MSCSCGSCFTLYYRQADDRRRCVRHILGSSAKPPPMFLTRVQFSLERRCLPRLVTDSRMEYRRSDDGVGRGEKTNFDTSHRWWKILLRI